MGLTTAWQLNWKKKENCYHVLKNKAIVLQEKVILTEASPFEHVYKGIRLISSCVCLFVVSIGGGKGDPFLF